MGSSGTDPHVVVGVDGSQPSITALRWAARQAELTGATLHAVTAWEYPPTYSWSVAISDDIAAATGTMLSEAVLQALGPQPPVQVRESVLPGHPARVLLDAAAEADLLVVGSRGRGGVAGALLGSVSQYCAQHARCPVVIVRDRA